MSSNTAANDTAGAKVITIYAIHIGQPQTHNDEQGTWRSSIYRRPVNGPIDLGVDGLAGDQVTDTRNHGSPDQAVCCHALDHYTHWNQVYGATLGPGSIGENWTLAGPGEAAICIGDVYTVGTAQVQVTGPRVPCSKQERKLQLPNFLERTIEALRTGFYLRVLTPGVVATGDVWELVERPHPQATLTAVNRSRYQTFDPALAEKLAQTPDLMASWRRYFQKQLQK